MKTVPPTCPEPDFGPAYWRSLDQLADTPEFRQWMEREFPDGASEFNDGVSRRHFVKIMSASFLLAGMGLTGCRRPEHQILPFSSNPEGYTHGVPQFYATAMPAHGAAVPLLARSNDGRPTKVEGNPEHPDSNGGTDTFAQASVLDLYDPDRAIRFSRRGSGVTREEAFQQLAKVAEAAAGKAGAGLCFLIERSGSPSRARLQAAIKEKLPQARWYAYDPIDFDVHRRGASLACGKAVAPYYKLDSAKVIVSLDWDFIGAEENAFVHIRRFSEGRRQEKPDDEMNRLYVAEALFTLSGMNADHRLRIPSSLVPAVAARLALEVLRQDGQGGELVSVLERFVAPVREHEAWIVECAKDLLAHRGECLVAAGYRQPVHVHVLAQAINFALGNVGKTVLLNEVAAPSEGDLTELAVLLDGGAVETLVILGGNPAYTAPADLNWAARLRKAGMVIRLGQHEDETTAASDWNLPQAHYLESWGDARSGDGTIVSIQPLIEPLFGGVTELEVLARVAGLERTNPHDIVRETFHGPNGGDENDWRRFLHAGFRPDTAYPAAAATFDAAAAAGALKSVPVPRLPGRDNLEVILHRDSRVDDGRGNNNGWLQEFPDPITKLTWENAVLMSAATARELGVYYGERSQYELWVPTVRVKLGDREVEGPVWIQPGMADHTIGLALGYGRSRTGRVGTGSGFNAYRLLTSDGGPIAVGATVTVTGRNHQLAGTQNHWMMEGRPIVREANLEDYRKHPHFVEGMDLEKPPSERALYPNPLDVPDASGVTPRQKALHQWGMVIDLSTCVGCSACVLACQSENNVPIVGKKQVAKSREMHWLRIDRYFAGSVEDPQAVPQPMLCQHCESAPCESVCPVNATVHDREGLNLMIYNRCVGTRYCSNNCPYKVRRFNFFDYNRRPLDDLYQNPITGQSEGQWDLKRWFKNPSRGSKPELEWDLLRLVKNPNVSVRMRGVMEKCTFCVQRIEEGKIAQKVKAGASGDVEVPDGRIKTACQQACPAGAITFGNLGDPASQVSMWKDQDRNYSVLEFLATKPRLTYLARIRNPNPQMPDYQEMPLSLRDYSDKMGSPFERHHNGSQGAPAGTQGAAEKGAH